MGGEALIVMAAQISFNENKNKYRVTHTLGNCHNCGVLRVNEKIKEKVLNELLSKYADSQKPDD